MAIAAGAKLLRIAAATINFLVRSIAVRGGVERVIARQTLEAAPVIDLGERGMREGECVDLMEPVVVSCVHLCLA